MYAKRDSENGVSLCAVLFEGSIVMEYRINRRTGDAVSIIGMGTSSLPESQEDEAVATLRMAYEQGINYYDLATADSRCFALFGAAFADVRSKVRYQIHFGAIYAEGKSYAWSLNLDKIKRSIAWQLEELKTDYIDYGFIHCLDEEQDWQTYQKNGVLRYLEELKRQNIVHHLGFSTHNPVTANHILDTNLMDMMMFSINAGYDYQHGEFARGSALARMELYQRCEAMGVGISVMKPFSGGQLLQDKTSPFGRALTSYQCIQYVLDKPGVLTVLPGIRNRMELQNILGFFDAAPEERDYSLISTLTPKDMDGRCVYCNHCQPCPSGLDVGLINKYYDLARAGDELAVDHYKHLILHADACNRCGHCNRRCPFHVDQVARMKEIDAYFAHR